MRLLLTSVSLLFIVALTGCNRCLEGFRQIEVGQPLPETLPPGMYRSAIGVGHFEIGWWPLPLAFWRHSLHVLTDADGIVIAKAYRAFDYVDVILLAGQSTEKIVIDVQVPESWWLPPAGKLKAHVATGLSVDWQQVRKELKEAPPEVQRKYMQRWTAWYEKDIGHADATRGDYFSVPWLAHSTPPPMPLASSHVDAAAPQPLRTRNVTRYLSLMTELLQTVPVQKTNPEKAGDRPDALLMTLFVLREADLDLSEVTKKNFEVAGEGFRSVVRVRNLGGRVIRLEQAKEENHLGLVSSPIAILTAPLIQPFLPGEKDECPPTNGPPQPTSRPR